MKKRSIGLICVGCVLGLVVVPQPAKALFGIDDAIYLIRLWQQAQQLYSLEQSTQRTLTNTAAFLKHPNWRSALSNASQQTSGILHQYSNGNDAVSVKSIDASLAAADQAFRELQSAAQVSSESAGVYSVLQFQAAQAKIERDRIAADLQFQQDVSTALAGGAGLGSVSRSIQGWRMK